MTNVGKMALVVVANRDSKFYVMGDMDNGKIRGGLRENHNRQRRS